MLECCLFFFFQAEDGIRDLVRSRGLGDVYKRQPPKITAMSQAIIVEPAVTPVTMTTYCANVPAAEKPCLLYTSDAADERSSVDLGGRRIIKKKNIEEVGGFSIVNIEKCTSTSSHGQCVSTSY